MKTILKIVLKNFKRFRQIEIPCNESFNIFIGDNETGKSSILQAIDLVSRGSVRRIEDIGLDRLFNADAVREFMESNRAYEDLPIMSVELYFADTHQLDLNGLNNGEHRVCDGLRMECHPDDGYGSMIRNVLMSQGAVFPFEFYKTEFHTFSGDPYNGYTRKHGTLMIDHSAIGNPYAMNEYVQTMYRSQTTNEQRLQIKHNYHLLKEQFARTTLAQFSPSKDGTSAYSVKDNSTDNIETALTLHYQGVPLENKGTGQLCFIKTELALKNANDNIDAILIEEPENHLSYGKMLQLLRQIRATTNKQLFISTHSDMIATRINLRACTLFCNDANRSVRLNEISEETAKFFMKAPDNNLLQFVLSRKAILVEGDAEYILMDKFFEAVTGQTLEQNGVAVIAVDGKCFKRYLEIARRLSIKTAVITDNDHNYEDNIHQSYEEYINGRFSNIAIFADADNNRYTFEVCVYNDNKALCDELFSPRVRKLSEQEYMLNNKSEAAYQLLLSEKAMAIPQYIQDAIGWIMS